MKSKIIATIGPSSFSYPVLKKMKKEGMSIGRTNTKYGNKKEWERVVKNLRKLKVDIMIDIKSLETLEWVNTQKINYLAVSYAQNAKQIKKIKSIIQDKSVKIISKIESRKGLNNIDGIIKESDGIMIARGDLSKNIPFEKVPYYKKLIIDKCIAIKKFVIVATEMLISLMLSNTATISEVEDVFSAVVEGGNGVMLSEETAIGKYPTLSVKTMKKIVVNAEKYLKK